MKQESLAAIASVNCGTSDCLYSYMQIKTPEVSGGAERPHTNRGVYVLGKTCIAIADRMHSYKLLHLPLRKQTNRPQDWDSLHLNKR